MDCQIRRTDKIKYEGHGMNMQADGNKYHRLIDNCIDEINQIGR